MCQDLRANTSYPRGLRNNNPGNIRDDGTLWQGKIGTDTDGFLIFANTCWGIRALATDLTNKINKGLDTITKIISVYAPATDNNNVAAYIQAVSNSSGVGADEQLGTDPQTIADLIRAVMDHENGGSAIIPDSDIAQGISMMGLSFSTLADAAQIAVENDPTTAILIGIAFFGGLYLLSRRK